MTELICIVCPRGCHLTVDENLNVTGNTCKRGEIYGKNEIQNPTRVITSTVKLEGGCVSRLPVKTSEPVPKGKIFEVMQEINHVCAHAPVKIGDVLIPHVLGLDSDVIATRDVDAA